MNSKSRIPILLIEDNPGDVAIMKTRLDEAGIRYDLFHEDTLRDGLELLKKREIELALLDLNLPDSNGFRTLTTFLEKAPEVPVILITGMNNEIIGNQAVKAGAQDYLVKGHFDGKLLGRSIRYAIQRANEIIYSESGFYSAYNEAAFSEDFVFRGPYIGPLNKRDYLSTMDTFKIYEAIPDISPNAFGFSIDPSDPNRVWFMVRNSGTATGELGLDRSHPVAQVLRIISESVPGARECRDDFQLGADAFWTVGVGKNADVAAVEGARNGDGHLTVIVRPDSPG